MIFDNWEGLVVKCKNCGAEFSEGMFCPECGEKYFTVEASIDESKVEKKTCPMCGTEFAEGIFCPECGAKVVDTNDVDLTDQYDHEAKKLENEAKQIEAERVKAEAERLEKEAELKRLQVQQEQLKKEADQRALEDRINRTFKNVEYATIEECNKAKLDSETIDKWIAELSKSKKQKKRQEIFAGLPVSNITTPAALERISILQSKIDVPEPAGNKINFFIGIVALVCFVLLIVIPTGNISVVLTAIGSIAFWTWLIWKIVIVVKSRSKGSYLYLKDI